MDRRRRSDRRRRPPDDAPPREPQQAGAVRRQPRHSGNVRRRRRGGFFLRLFALFLVVAVFLAGLLIFFKVTDIQVTGSQLYSRQEVVEASGIQVGDNLATLDRSAAAARIVVRLPYIESVHVSRVLPGTVVLDVTETAAAYSVEAEDGTSWLVSSAGKVLEETPVSAADYPRLTGVTLQSPEPGQPIATGQESGLAAAELVMHALEETSFLSQIAEIDVTETYDIVVWLGTQYEIHLGGTDQLDYKIEYLGSILDQLDGNRGGTIDLTLEEKNVAIFREWETIQPAESDSDENSPDIS